MENHRTISTANDVEIELPLETIQHIQTRMIQSSKSKFRGENEAARTSLVSKSWYGAWSTRPDLVLDQYYFSSSRADLFSEFAKTTVKRYEDLNLNIRSLRLRMRADDVSLDKELIVKATKLGVVDLTIEILHGDKQFALPDEVLQSRTLARLHLSGHWGSSDMINRVETKTKRKGEEEEVISCFISNLKSLKLDNLYIDGDLLRDLISRCRLIEEFALYHVYDTRTNLLEFDKLHHYFPKLKCLSLELRRALPSHEDLWPKFACLKELKIRYYRNGNDDIRIRIPSLERISITLLGFEDVNIVEFDFPNIRKIQWDSYDLPRRFELKTGITHRDEWGCEIDIEMYRAEWFTRLSRFVRMLSLSRSRVSLAISIKVCIRDDVDEFTYVGDGLAIPAVEKLKLRGRKVTPAFLDALFWSCRPKFVEIQNQCLIGLKKVNVEEFQQLRSLPWQTFYHVSSDGDEYVRFQLNRNRVSEWSF